MAFDVALQSDSEFDRSSDPFEVRKAGAEALLPKSLFVKAAAEIADKLLIAVSASPFALLLLLPILAVLYGGTHRLWAYAAVFFWVWFVAFGIDQLRLLKPASGRLLSRSEKPSAPNKTIVIGAGPVGLAVVKECLAHGVDVECFESKEGLGGVYRYDKASSGGVYKTTRLTSSPWITAFSDFPPSSASSAHHSHDEYLAYLAAYADHFQLGPRIHFGHHVVGVEPVKAGWSVCVRDGRSQDLRTIECARVVICTGLHQSGKAVSLPGAARFRGEIRHISTYKEAAEYQGKSVVVSGLGESGADIAYELSSVAKMTLLSICRGKFVIPRINPQTGLANDYDTNRIRNATPAYLRDGWMSLRRRLCSKRGRHTPESAARYRLLQLAGVGPTSQTATKSDDFIRAILQGDIALRHKISRVEENSVVFSDGVRETADVILLAHGYRPEFPFLQLPQGTKERHPSCLYLQMFHPDLGDSLAFCGFSRPALGAIPPVGELQARLVAQLAAGHRLLPSKEEMLKCIDDDLRKSASRFPGLERGHHTVVAWLPYMDTLADLIGCRPDPWKLLRSPRLLWKIATGPVNGAHYRLHGPGAAAVARKTVLSLPRGHELLELLAMLGLHFWSWPLGIFQRDAAYYSEVSCT